jgi:hypothetical protein
MRNIREAGILTQGGRGRSAAVMTAADAAHLLIASVASTGPKDSVEVSKAYSRILRGKYPRWEPPLIKGIDTLPPRHTFGEAFIGLIESAIQGDFHISNDFDAVVLTFFWPWQSARIDYYRPNIQRMQEQMLQRDYELDAPFTINYGNWFILAKNRAPIPPPGFANGDLQQERKITHRTILAVAKCLGLPGP